MNGEMETAIEEYQQLLQGGDHIFNKFIEWELMWIYALNCQWDDCIRFSQSLRERTLHSPVITTYCEAVFRYFKAYKTCDMDLKAEATQLMRFSPVLPKILIKINFELIFRSVPNLMSRTFGKTLTFEKGCIESAEQYLDNNEYLFLPVMVIFDLAMNFNQAYFPCRICSIMETYSI